MASPQVTTGYWPADLLEGTTDAGLEAIATVEESLSNAMAAIVSRSSENGGQSDENEDSSESSSSDEDISPVEAGEVVEEEIVELEFEKVKPKLATHSMHCPNCKSEITKVVLRRKVIMSRRPDQSDPVPVEPERDPDNLVGCLSCLSLFTRSGNGGFNPFDIFRKKPDPTNVLPPQTTVDGTTPVVTETENCFSMFLVFKKKQKVTETVDAPQTENVDRDSITSDDPTAPKYVTGNASIAQGPLPTSPAIIKDDEVTSDVVDSNKRKKGLKGSHSIPSPDPLPTSSNAPDDGDTTIDVDPEPETAVVITGAPVTGRAWFGYEGILAEILKSIVYGGLMEVIGILSVVASAAASETATLNIIALAVASLIGGIVIMWNNIWDLRNDCYSENPDQQTEGEAKNKYKELFGRVNYFPLHTFFATLSFVVFGMVPPVAYAISFDKTSDRDFTMVAVAIASLLCVALLALFKAFINECGVWEYFKTVSYYITMAVSASGVSYVAGNLVTRLVTELGLFDSSSGGGMSLLSQAATPSLASF